MSEPGVVAQGRLALRFRFPFGRYAATPWFRSRREHVGNVEWPPSPWRLSRSLVAIADGFGDREALEGVEALVQALAVSLPSYRLPSSGEVLYTQWMPRLDFNDSQLASDRLDNGHTLLTLAPDAELTVIWEGVSLPEWQQALLERLLPHWHHLGQSVSVCEVAPADSSVSGLHAWAAESAPVGAAAAATKKVSLLAPNEAVTLAHLQMSTKDGLLKALPAPPGSRWVDYLVEQHAPPVRTREQPLVSQLIYRLDGVLTPVTPRPERPTPRVLSGPGGGPRSHKVSRFQMALQHAWGYWPNSVSEVVPLDDDGDGRADRLLVRLDPSQPADRISKLLDPPSGLESWRQETRERISADLHLQAVTWEGAGKKSNAPPLDPRPLVFRLEGERLPLIFEAISVAEVFHRRLMGVAARRFGADAIPSRLTGRTPAGEPLRDHHAHIHILPLPGKDHAISHLLLWAPSGFTADERAAIQATSLPKLLGTPLSLQSVESHPVLGSARVWRSITPFLPARHWKRRRARWVDTVEEQVARELVERGFPRPIAVSRIGGPWTSFRILRLAKPGCNPTLGAHGVRVEFAAEVSGPVALGRNSHFGMGVLAPAEET